MTFCIVMAGSIPSLVVFVLLYLEEAFEKYGGLTDIQEL
jgi:hypothetical protein